MSESSVTPTIRHRHLLVAPLCGVFVAVCLWAGGQQFADVPASVIQANASSLSLPEGAAAVLDAQTVAAVEGNHVHLTGGSLVVRAVGIAEVQAGSARIRGWGGVYSVLAMNESITVAAITSPVLVTIDGTRVIVPVGFSWRARSLPTFEQGIYAWFTARAVQPLPPSYIVDVLDQAPDAASLGTDSPTLSVGHVLDDSGRMAQLLPGTLATADHWLLAAFHPVFRNTAWVVPVPADLPAEELLLAVLLQPQSNHLAEGIAQPALAAWQRRAEIALALSDMPKEAAILLENQIRDAARATQQMGYVEREEFYSQP